MLSFFYWLVKIRYTIKISWKHLLDYNGPILVLPNHPAMIDPVIISTHLSSYGILSPVVTEQFYNKPLLNTIFRSLDAICVPDLESWSSDTQWVKEISQHIINHLSNSKRVLLYPSGQTYRQWYESLIGKKITYDVIKSLPDNTKIILVRTRWLRWSIFSKAYFGTPVPLGKIALSAFWYMISNVLLFGPRRKISIHIEDKTKELLSIVKNQSMQECNTYLEEWYNQKGYEKALFVRHYRWRDDGLWRKQATHIQWSLDDVSTIHHDYSQISDQVLSRVSELIHQVKKHKMTKVYQVTTWLLIDIHCDSLDMAEIKSLIIKHFSGTQDISLIHLKTVWDLCLMAMWKTFWETVFPPYQSIDIVASKSLLIETAWYDTILWYWTNCTIAWGKNSWLYDVTGWVQTHTDIRLKALLVSRYLRQFKGRYIWVMLPAVASTHIVLLACYIAKKVPVMMNWTVWSEMFAHCIKTSKITHIITSQRFTNVLNLNWLTEYDKQLVYLEVLLANVWLMVKLQALIKSLLFPWTSWLMIPHSREHDPAVVLFTSGSESKPKSIVLSHRNILSNLSWVLWVFKIYNTDILLHCLPPFHSFWFTVNTILSCVTWLRVVATPNPTDASTIIKLLVHTRATIITATPTFLQGILSIAQVGELYSLRAAIVGAEKCSHQIMEDFARHCPHGEIIEWYGITECSPVIAVNPLWSTKPGTVGTPLSNGLLLIKNLDTWVICGTWQQGMIYWSAPSVFTGYQDSLLESPFEQINGREYYKTWDLWYLDADWYLTITGRLKRFVKIAGEMISLPAIEQHLYHRIDEHYPIDNPKTWWIPKKVWPRIALEAKENEDGSVRFVVFITILDISVDLIQEYLSSVWASWLVHIDHIMYIPSIPLLGSGKTDYKILKAMI